MPRWLALLIGFFFVTASLHAQAAVSLCVSVADSTNPQSGLEKLVHSEVRKHTSHTLAEKGCASRLVVELFKTGELRYLSVGLEGEVPLRYSITSDTDIEAHLIDGVTLALKSDPEHLTAGSESSSGIEHFRQQTLVHGMNTYRVEAFEMMARTDTGAAYAPGLGFGVHRGAEYWQIFARTYFAASPSAVEKSERVLRIGAGIDLGLAYEFSRRALTTPYVAGSVGVGFLRFEGLTDPSNRASSDYVGTLGAIASARVGLRTLRFFDFDADIFIAGSLPAFKTRRIDATLFGESGTYTPFVQLGAGVGF